MASTSTHAISSSYAPPQWTYDVFLSFRGKDTRNKFTSHLYTNLKKSGIDVYMDDRELERGETIEPALWKAIEGSRFSVVIFSKTYASSPWCLDELVKIVQCMKEMGHNVFPIFYDVDSSEVANQKGNYMEAFVEHEQNFCKNLEKVQCWKDCLTTVANLSGWDVRNRNESETVKKIVEYFVYKVGITLPSISKKLVGIDSRLEVLNDYLNEEANDVIFIGIFGMGGIGKTTLARVLYDRIRWQFEGSCFLANVREVSATKDGQRRLQEQLLSEILMERATVWDCSRGIDLIKRRLRLKKVLLILDDVAEQEQLEMLAMEHRWFGMESRIIITSRNKNILDRCGVSRIYEAEKLNDNDALVLFSWKAFKKDQPAEDFMELCKKVVGYADGLALALEVIGSFLWGRSVAEWESAINRLKEIPHGKIIDVLRISFDGLHVLEKKIFLDIACFFKGMKKDRIIRILDGCGFHANIGIQVLIEKSLINVSRDEVWMHNLLEVMGKEIVRCESSEMPGRRSRLWTYKDVCHALVDINKGKESIESILLDMPEMKEAQWNMKAFTKMSKLRLLKIHNVQLSEGPEYLSNELRFLEWHAYPSTSLPACFKPDELVELDVSYSNIHQLWYGLKNSVKLKVINLSHSLNLTQTPDFSGIPNLEKLILEGCTSLSEVHPSLGLHKKLHYVNLVNCKSLKSLPSYLEMQLLRICTLDGCSKLDKFPDIKGDMNFLMELRLDGTGISELPSSIHHLVGLHLLYMNDCKNLESIPNSISGLKSLKKLDLSGCCELKNLPESLGKLEGLEELDVSRTSIIIPPASIFHLKNLKTLSFDGCKRIGLIPVDQVLPSLCGLYSLEVLDLCACNLWEGALPEDIGCLSSLRYLDLSRNNFVSLPKSINQLSRLQTLLLEDCRMLYSLPEVPSKVQTVNLNGCIRLSQAPDPGKLCSLETSWFECLNCWELYKHNGHDCLGMIMLKRYMQDLPCLRPGFGITVPGSKIPDYFTHQSKGSSISVQVPAQLDCDDGEWIGFTACVAFSAYDESPSLSCSFKASGIDYYPLPMCICCNSIQILSDHLWLFYLSLDYLKELKEWKHECFSNVELSFLFYEKGVKVKNCAVCLVYNAPSMSISSLSSSAHLIVATKSKEATSSSIASFSLYSYFCQWMRNVSLSFRDDDASNNFTAYLYTALVQRGITWEQSELEREKEIEPRLLKAIEDSRLSIIIFTGDHEYTPWCINKLVHIIEYANNQMNDIVFPVLYAIQTLNSDNGKGSCTIVIDEDQDDFMERKKKVERIQETSSFSSPQWRYDVFLSFRGNDTSNPFISHLYANLMQNGVDVYMDDRELEIGKTIDPALWKVIEESRFSIIIVSRDYASSPWCLDELVKIVQCMKEMGHTVLPVFYYVDPLEIAEQEENYMKAFSKLHERRSNKVGSWKNCLTIVANLSGWDVRKRSESEIIEKIVEYMVYKQGVTVPTISTNLVGIDFRVRVLNAYMREEARDILVIGIFGMDGIGKTTLARVLYDRIHWQFEGSCFIANVREVFAHKDGPRRLQTQLFSDILMEHIAVWECSREIDLVKWRLRRKKILLILDDVDELEQLQTLAAKHEWFGSGSRIIITSSHKNVLEKYGVGRIYEVEQLNDYDALKLFSWKAFKKDQPPEDLTELSNRVLSYAKGHPLALEVIGLFLHGRSRIQWENSINRLNAIPNVKAIDVLRISFDGLHILEKKIFLDIACFFKGMKKDRIIRILDGCGFYANIGLQVLIERSLIRVSQCEVWMNNLLQMMGKEIVHCESPEKPERCSRLWTYKDVCLAMMGINKEKEKIESIFLDMPETQEVQWNMEAFSEMRKLRLLKIHNVQLSGGPEYLPNELRFLEWHAYPATSLPTCFKPDELVELDMSYSSIQILWHGFKSSVNLKIINLSHSLNLTKTPDFAGFPNLERLVLEGCTSLSHVHPSLGLHKKLQYVNFANCISLGSLASNLEMESLRICILDGCSELGKFPDIEGNMNCLMELHLDGTGISELPASIHHLVGLGLLSMNNCKKLESIPDSISGLKFLGKLDLSGCVELKNLPENLGRVGSLEELNVSGTSIRQLPASIFILKNLKALSCDGCKRIAVNLTDKLLPLSGLHSLEKLNLCACNLGEGVVPQDIGCLSSLRFLDLSRNKFVSLPKSLNNLFRLEILVLEDCRMLKSLPEVPSNVQVVKLNGCIRLTQVPDPIKLCSLQASCFECLNCWELYKHNGHDSLGLTMLKRYLQESLHLRPGFGIVVPGRKLPVFYSHQSKGSSISVQVPSQFEGDDNDWIGFAACVAFSSYGESPCLFSHLKANGEEDYPLPMYFRCNSIQVLSDHLWLFYLSLDYLKELQEWKYKYSSNFELSFHFYGQGVKVTNCGVSLVYSPSSPPSASYPAILSVATRSKDAAASSIASFAFFSYRWQWMHDVLVSFRDADTSNNFTPYLYATLVQRGIVSADRELEGEKAIELTLLKATEESSISILTFRRDYDYKPWCIDELLHFIQYAVNNLKDTDFPVSYDIQPLNWDEQQGSCMIVFDKDEDDFRKKRMKLLRWDDIIDKVNSSCKAGKRDKETERRMMAPSYDHFWDYTEFTNIRLKCKFCGLEFAVSTSISRVKYHLSGVPHHGLKICDQVPQDVQESAYLASYVWCR